VIDLFIYIRPSINPTPTDELDNCAICLDVILKQEHAVGRLACGHEFHLSCIGSYFNCSGELNRMGVGVKPEFIMHD
jgi:hypothetical protein